jgi:hypothetical protein
MVKLSCAKPALKCTGEAGALSVAEPELPSARGTRYICKAILTGEQGVVSSIHSGGVVTTNAPNRFEQIAPNGISRRSKGRMKQAIAARLPRSSALDPAFDGCGWVSSQNPGP